MAKTEINLDLQTDKVITTPRAQDSIELQDATAVRKLIIDWNEPVGSNRTITLTDPGQDAELAYRHEVLAGQGWRELLLSSTQLDNTNDGIQPAGIFGLAGVPSDGETVIIRNNSDGTETYTWRVVPAVPFEVQIGGDVPTSLANLSSQINTDSSWWAAAVHTDLSSIDTSVVLIRKLIPDDGDGDRLYGSTANGVIVDYGVTDADFDYSEDSLTALPNSDPARRNFGIGRATASLVPGEQHLVLAEDEQYAWDADGGVWHQIGIVTPTATSAPGGGVQGKVSADENLGLEIVGGVMRVKTDGVTTQVNGLGEIEAIGGGGGGGALTATASYAPEATRDITGVTAPSSGNTGTDTDTLDYPDGSTTGQRFEFTVPDDYDSGDLTIAVNYRMSAGVASPNNQVRVQGQAEVHDVSTGSTTLLAAVDVDLTVPDGTTDIDRQALFTVGAVNIEAGDTVQLFVSRIGGHANDLATAIWKVITFEVTYTSAIANRAFTFSPEFFRDTDETPPTPVTIGTDTDAEEFPTGVDRELKFGFIVPENWDEATGPIVRATYLMTTAGPGDVRLATEGEVADTVGGSIVSLGVINYDFTPPTDTNIHRTTIIRELDPANLHPGDFVTLKLARRGSVAEDTHGGSFKLISLQVNWAGVAVGGFTTINAVDRYLELGIFNAISPIDVDGDTQAPDLTGDFEIYDVMTSTTSNGRIDAYYPGRLASSQSTLKQIRVGIKGVGTSPQYRLKIYVEAASPPHTLAYDSLLQAAPGTLTETVLTDVDLSAQPAGSKRFHILVEAHIDNLEEVHVSRPFVSQE